MQRTVSVDGGGQPVARRGTIGQQVTRQYGNRDGLGDGAGLDVETGRTHQKSGDSYSTHVRFPFYEVSSTRWLGLFVRVFVGPG